MPVRAKEAAERLREVIARAQAALGDLPSGNRTLMAGQEERLGRAVGELREAVEALAELAGREGDVADFDEFFASMGESLAQAQRKLDIESEKYLTETRSSEHVLPSVFRIPKVTANIRFALQSVRSEGVRLLFYSTREQTRDQHEQSVEFEIVSAPAPQEALAKLDRPRAATGRLPAPRGAPDAALVLLRADRARVFEVVRRAEPSGGGASRIRAMIDGLLEEGEQTTLDRIPLVRGAGDHVFYLVWAEDYREAGEEALQGRVALFRIDEASDPPSVQAVVPLGGTATDGKRNLHADLVAFADRLQGYLARES